MAFTIPNEADASNVSQATVDSFDIAALVQAYNREGVISGCAVTDKSGTDDMSVDVAAGLIRVGGYFCYVTAVNKSIATADSSNPRLDLVSVDYNGTVTVTSGTAAQNAIIPSLPSNSIPLATVYVPASDTAIGLTQVTDKRVIIPDTFDYKDDFTAGSATSVVIGEMGWTLNGATYSQQAGVASHPGIGRLAASDGSNLSIFLGGTLSTETVLTFGSVARFRFIVRVTTTAGDANDSMRPHLTDTLNNGHGSSAQSVGIFNIGTGNWVAHAGDGSSGTDASTGVSVTTNEWEQLDVVLKQDGTYQFAINGALVATDSTNIPNPSTAASFGVEVFALGAGGAQTMDVDFFGYNLMPMSTRYT